jgi:hypothetical protein
MAHFAKIEHKILEGWNEEKWVVTQIVKVGDDILSDGKSLVDYPKHPDGEVWCNKFFNGGVWKQTFKDYSHRRRYAGVGFIYDDVNDVFIEPRPYNSWILDEEFDWSSPIPYPTITTYTTTVEPTTRSHNIKWDEDNLKWISKIWPNNDSTSENYYWDSNNLNWIQYTK